MRSTLPTTALLLLQLALVSPLSAALGGRVVNSLGTPVEGVLVEVVDGDLRAVTDARGQFTLEGAEPPLDLLVFDPRFEPLSVPVAEMPASPLELVLVPKQTVFEEVVVSASRGEAAAPVSIAATLVRPNDRLQAPATLTDVVANVPGVAENGQGGIFQTYSIRGVARQRVLTLVSGMRIVGERRAGVSASFIDPLLMQSVDVLRGPASSAYGSGALGGVVQLFPRDFDGLSVDVGYTGNGDESHQMLGWGGEGWSVGLVHRRAGRAETAAGDTLNNGFSQVSSVVERSWSGGARDYRVQLVASLGDDIGKSNLDFPREVTSYPEERHLLARFEASGASGWRASAYIHPNELETRVDAAGGREELVNEALDLGASWQRELPTRAGVSSRVGVEYFGRRGVSAVETAFEAAQPVFSQRTLDDGSEDELGAFGAFEWSAGKVNFLAGGRFVWQSQSNAELPSATDTAWTGFGGLVAPLGKGFELVGNVGTGLRFPSLSERFFSGLTGRGRVIGNPALEPERSLSTDVGLRWFGRSLFVATYFFRNEIDDYVERIQVAPALRKFVNLTSGTLEGAEVEGFYRLGEAWNLGFGGHRIEGRDDAGAPLADVPADRLFASLGWARDAWGWEARWERRSAKDDPGSGERAIPSADLVTAAVSWQAAEGVELRLFGRNLLDEDYFNSADDQVPPAPGRALGVGLRWTRP